MIWELPIEVGIEHFDVGVGYFETAIAYLRHSHWSKQAIK